jgi:single-strand DNA-binding protein
MYRHAVNPAAQPCLSMKALCAPIPSRKDRNEAAEKPCFRKTSCQRIETAVWAGLCRREAKDDFGAWRFIRLVSRPLLGVTLRDLTGALRHGALLLPLCGPTGYGFQLRRTLRKCRAWHLGAGPTRSASPGVTRAAFGNFNKTEITTMYQNKVTLIGFLGNDAEFRSNDNRSFSTLSLATKSSYKKDGKYISHTEWHRCIVFGKLGEFAGTLKKGAHIQVEGELRSRKYDSKKTGTELTIWEIRVGSILKLDRAEKASPEEQEQDDTLPLEEAA